MLDNGVFGVVAVAAAALGLLGLLAALLALRALARMRRSLALLHREGDELSFIEVTGRNIQAVEALEATASTLGERLDVLAEELQHTVRRMSLVRYDAFPDVGGRMSFSVAMLGDDLEGIVVTAINGRHETRVYAKRVVNAESEQELSPEERQAIAQALGREPVGRQPGSRSAGGRQAAARTR